MGSKKSKNSAGYKLKKNSIIDDYIIKNEIVGKGLEGNILLCYKKADSNRKLALKILYYKCSISKEKAKNEYENHWKASENGKSEYIPKIFDVYKAKIERHRAYLVVMELVNGISLNEYNLEEARTRKFTEKRTAIIMRKLCDAVQIMHKQGIAHGSLISDNVIIIKDKHGEFENLKLVHFDDSIDTNIYSPLAIRDEFNSKYLEFCKKHQFSNDIYGLGLIMNYLLCYSEPPNLDLDFLDINHIEEWKNLSLEAKILLNGMLHNKSEARFSIEDVLKSPWINTPEEQPNAPLYATQLKNEIEKSNERSAKELEAELKNNQNTINTKYKQELEAKKIRPIELKDLNESTCELLKKRQNKNKQQQKLERQISKRFLQKQTSKIKCLN